MDELTVKRKMVQAADRVILLCDHSKIGQSSFSVVCDLAEIDVLISGRELAAPLVEELSATGCEVALA